MSNPARDLLNFVDEHKTEMKEGIYKGIVDMLVPINKEIEKRSKYKMFFLITDIIQCDGDESIHEATYSNKRIDIFLSDSEADYNNKQLDQYGNINQIWFNDHPKTQGLEIAETIRSIFVELFADTKVHCRVGDGDDDWKDGEIIYGNKVVITRIKKM